MKKRKGPASTRGAKSTRGRRNKRGFWSNLIKLLILGVLILGTLLFVWVSTFELPDLQSFQERKVYQTTKIYDRTGEILLYDLNKDTKRTIISYDKISRHIKNATVAIEDAEFYEHSGIKPTAILRAIFANISSMEFGQGGSTITQQVVKNSILTTEKKISRKLKEWVLSLKLEQILSKDEILALYLNESPYGGSVYGVEEASQVFFGKSAEEVTLAEAAYLAALPQAPTYYSPYGNNTDKLEQRKNLVLSQMLKNNFITEGEYKDAMKGEVSFKPRSVQGIRAPHFVFYVQEYLENKYGTKILEESGLRVITTLDYTLQEKAQEIVYRKAMENVEKFNAENASIVATDPKTGQILVMVGSRDYFDEEIDGNFNIAVAHRQPGSAFKPFVYANALSKGYTTETIVFDLPTEFSSECKPDGEPIFPDANCYMPGNYDGVYRGPTTFRDALAQSINIPAVKALYLSGLNDSLRLARNMGITSLEDSDRYGLTLVLGGGEVSLIDITSAYSVFANDGIKNPHTPILRVEDSEGNVLEEFQPRPQEVLGKSVVRDVSDMLSDNDARAPAFGQNSYLYFPRKDVAVKTGTTNDYRDAWIIGYTPNVSVGAWAGNNDNSSMEKKVAGFIIAPMWNEFMKIVLEKFPDEKFKKNIPENDQDLKPSLKGIWEGGEQYIIDKISGKLATEYTPEETKEVKVVRDVHSILYWVDLENPRGEKPKNPQTISQFERWEYAVQKWLIEKGIQPTDTKIIPTTKDDIHIPQNFPRLSVNGLESSYPQNSTINLSILSNGTYPLSNIAYYINDVYVGSKKSSPFNISINLRNVPNLSTKNRLKIVGQDSVYNKTEIEVMFSTD